MSPIASYCRQKVLNNISVSQEIIYTSIILLIVYGLRELMNKKNILSNVNKEGRKYLLINGLLASFGLYLGGIILTKENVLKYKTIQKPVYTIVLLIIGVCIYKEKITIVTLIGVMLLLFGIFLIEKSKKA
jgi:uncharacterized membrane protein